MNTSEFPSLQEENHLKVLRLLEAKPQLSQRGLAVAMGVIDTARQRVALAVSAELTQLYFLAPSPSGRGQG